MTAKDYNGKPLKKGDKVYCVYGAGSYSKFKKNILTILNITSNAVDEGLTLEVFCPILALSDECWYSTRYIKVEPQNNLEKEIDDLSTIGYR